MKRTFSARATKIARCALLAAMLPFSMAASQIDITVTGVVLSGTDGSGIFGLPNSDITGDAYQLVFTFNDALGTQTEHTCSGTSYVTSIASTPSSNPGTATLSIGGGSFTFGVVNAAELADSEAAENDTPCSDSQIALSAGDGHFGDGSGISGSVEAAAGTNFGANPNWDAPFTDTDLARGESFGFEISELDITGQRASGELTAQTITVGGPEASAPEPSCWSLIVAAMAFLASAGSFHRLRRRTARAAPVSPPPA